MKFVWLMALGMTACVGDRGATEDLAGTDTPAAQGSLTHGPVEVSVRAAPGAVSVGEPLTLTIDVLAEPGAIVEMPAVGETLGDFTVTERRTPPDIPDGARRRWTHTYRLSTFASGDRAIPALPLRLGPEPDAETIQTPPITVSVRSLVGDDADPSAFADIKGPVAVSTGATPLALGLGVAAIAVAVAVAAFLLWRRRRRTLSPAVEPTLPPHEWAQRELDALAAAGLLEQERVHEFFVRLADIVREYLERRFGVRAPERTTQEFIREMRAHPVLEPAQQEALGGFLRAADMVKFALHRPPAREARLALDAASSFVVHTTPATPAAAVAPAPPPAPSEAAA